MSETVNINEMMEKKDQDTVFFAQRVEFEKKQLVLGIGESATVKLELYPKEAVNRPVSYRYSDGDVIALDEKGTVTALGKGTAKIIAQCDYGTDLCEINVEKGRQKTDLPDIIAVMLEEKQMLLDYAVIHGDGILSFVSENAQIAEVAEHNILKLKQVGDTYIHCMCSETSNYDGLDKKVKLSVRYGINLQLDGIETRNVENGIRIKWNKVENVDGYFIYKKRAKGRKELIANIAADKELMFLDKDVRPGEQYTFFVQPYNGEYMGILPETGVPQIFLDRAEVKKIVCADKAIHLEWNRVQGAEGYYIYRKSNLKGWCVINALLQDDTLNYDDTDVVSGQEYTYIVSAYKGKFQGELNLQGYNIRYLDIPDIEKINNGIGVVRIQWNRIEGAQGYYIYKKNKRRKWERIGWIKDSKRTVYTDQSVDSGSEYVYTIRAYYNKQLSDYNRAGQKNVYLDSPKLQDVKKQDNGMKISWNKVKHAVGYNIYRKKKHEKWNRIGFVSGENSLEYQDVAVDTNMLEQYMYTVRACSKNAISAYDKAGICYKNKE